MTISLNCRESTGIWPLKSLKYSNRLKIAGGPDAPKLLKQIEKIDRLNDERNTLEI
jgi:hypothetical protein